MPTIHLLIKGKVQGVFYRVAAKEKAIELGLNGWIKNTPDEHVECIASGEEEAVDTFIHWCKTGPPKAVVNAVEIKLIEEKVYSGFVIIKK